jgi:hypothetical protein
MPDRFQNTASSLSGPAFHAFAITPNDSTNFAETTRALFAGSAGNIAAVMASGAEITFASVTAGTILPVRVNKVLASGTTARDIVGLV